jgi:type I restriction enzyme M protein
MSPRRKAKSNRSTNNGATLGFEKRMWEAADALRGSMDAAEYKHVVLGIIFLKYISDSFEEHHARLEAGRLDKGIWNNPEKLEFWREQQ